MQDRIDELKALRLDRESEYLNLELIESMGKMVTDDLVKWCNTEIFAPKNGKLEFEIPYWGEPNASVTVHPSRPFHPKISIRLSLLREIYRDSFAFPSISKRIATETQTISHFNQGFISSAKVSADNNYTFDTVVPQIPTRLCKGNLSQILEKFIELNLEANQQNLDSNDIVCRFIMFELMVAWVFFHELAHAVQGHHIFKLDETKLIAYHEMDEFDSRTGQEINSQAREILADIEGVDFTLQYMKRKNIYGKESVYLLLCAQNCMFHRFSMHYDINLKITDRKHPHPVIRNDFVNNYLMHWVVENYSIKDNTKNLYYLKLGLVYISTRSAVVAGLFWTHRVEKNRGDNLPPFMRLQSEEFQAEAEKYRNELKAAIVEQLPAIKKVHCLQLNFIKLMEASLLDR